MTISISKTYLINTTKPMHGRFLTMKFKNISRRVALIALSLFPALIAHAKDLPGATQTSYAVSPSGAFSFQVPIVTPVGRNGVQPNLSLSFSSASGNGPLGVGWNLSGLGAISRCGRTIATDGVKGGVLHDQNDRFCLNGQRLILVSGSTYGAANSEYRTELDSFVKVVAKGSSSNVGGGSAPESWEVWHKDGMISEYGNSPSSKFRVTSQSIHSWMVSEVRDRSDNAYTVDYTSGYPRPSTISYIGGHTVVFNYLSRTDVRSRYIVGQEVIFDKRLDSVEVKRNTTVLRKYKLAYEYAALTEKSKLTSITECGRDDKCMPSIDVDWEADAKGFSNTTVAGFKAAESSFLFDPTVANLNREITKGAWADVNGDGRVDQIIAYRGRDGGPVLRTYLQSTNTAGAIVWENDPEFALPMILRDYSRSIMNASYNNANVMNHGQLIDVNGDGLVDIVYGVVYQYYDYQDQTNKIATKRETWINKGNDADPNGRKGWRREDPNGNNYTPPDLMFSYIENSGELTHYSGDQCVNGCQFSGFIETNRGRFVDINADGLVDWVRAYNVNAGPDKIATWLNTGSGWQHTPAFNLPDIFAEFRGPYSLVHGQLIDLDGDGRLDWLQSYHTNDELTNPNGGHTGAWLNKETGFEPAAAAYELDDIVNENVSGWTFPRNRGTFIDVNGDGLVDYVMDSENGSTGANSYYSSTNKTWLNTAKGWVAAPNYNAPFIHKNHLYIGHTGQAGNQAGANWPLNINGHYIDINRDGLVDYVQSFKDVFGQVQQNTWVNTGQGWELDSDYQFQHLFYDYSGLDRSKVRYGNFLDINADGSPDWVQSRHGESFVTQIGNTGKSDRVDKITTTAGVEVIPEFGSAISTPNLYTKGVGTAEADSLHIISPMYLTSELAVTNAIGGLNVSEYQYKGAQVSRRRGFLGFETFVSTDTVSGLKSESSYRQDYPYIGRMKSSVVRETSAASDSWLSQSTATYDVKSLNAGKTILPYADVQTSQTRELDENGGAQFEWSKVENTFDDYGNVVKSITERGLNASALLHRSTVDNTYEDALEADWLVGRLGQTKTTLEEPGVTNSTIVRTTDFTYKADKKWLLESVIREPDSSDLSLKLTTTYNYDDYGNIRSETQTGHDPDPIGTGSNNASRTTITVYGADDRLPTSVTNSLSQVASTAYDDFCDQPDLVTDINGLQETFKYDEFCRVTETKDAINVVTTLDYLFENLSCSSCSVAPRYSIKTSKDGESPIEVFYDQFSQSVLSKTKGMPESLFAVADDIEQQTHYDARGRVIKQSQPYFVGESIQWTHSVYDKLNRPSLSILPYPGSGTSSNHPSAVGKAVVQYGYTVELDRQKRTVIDPLGQTKTTFANSLGQVAEVRDHDQAPLVYDYSASGNLVQTVASDSVYSRQSTITIEYDTLGRRTSLNDPSLGLSSFTYDAFSQMRTQSNANSQTLSMRYDALGRLRERDVPVGNSIETSVWTYDVDLTSDASGKAVGRISSIQRGSVANFDERLYFYDEYGRPSSKRTWIRSEHFDEAFTYDQYGRLESRAYPSSGSTLGEDNVFAVGYEYDNGFLKSITGLDAAGQKCITHWTANKYDALGRVEIGTLGKLVKTTREYDAAQGVIDSIHSVLTVGAQTVVQDLSYEYDANNNLESRSDTQTGVFEEFTYDHLDRLETHTRTLNGTSADVTVTYDALGNIRSKSDVGTYNYADASKPHLLTSVTSSVTSDLAKFEVDWEWNGEAAIKQAQPDIHNQTYKYDNNGSITEQGDRRVYWTAFDKPHTMVRIGSDDTQRGSIIDYNADFERNYKEEKTFTAFGNPEQVDAGASKEATFYIGKDYEKIIQADGTIKHRYSIRAGDGIVQIEREDNSDKDQPKYMLTDNLGSVSVILDNLGNVEQRLEFDPWGMRVAGPEVGTVNSITNKGYTGHEMDDEVGLINMNARIYDPYLGRFLSADPVLPDAEDMQAFNRYAYVLGNPLKYTDPSGNFPEAAAATFVVSSIINTGLDIIFGGRRGRPQCNCVNTHIPHGEAASSLSGLGGFFIDFSQIADAYNQQSSDSESVSTPTVGVSIPIGNDGDRSPEDAPPALLFSFDGAGNSKEGYTTTGNIAFLAFVRSLGLNTVYFDSGVNQGQEKNAAIVAREFLSRNPNGLIYATGYSSGGKDAIDFVNLLAREGTQVRGLVTFDPRPGCFCATPRSYTLDPSVNLVAVNFYQRNGNPGRRGPISRLFRGGELNGPGIITNFNLTSSNHEDIITDALSDISQNFIARVTLGAADSFPGTTK